MSACVHTPKYPDLLSVPTQQEAISRCSVVEGDERVAKQRALTAVDGESTRIDAAYWRDLSETQKAAVVAHERAHPCIGMEVDCEGCADKVGGYFMRAWGYAPHVIRDTFSSLRVQRDLARGHGNIAANAHEGARRAERALAERGLLGKTSAFVSSQLTIARQPSTATKLTSATTAVTRPSLPVAPTSPLQPVRTIPPGSTVVDPGGPGTSTLTPAPEGTKTEPGPPSVDADVKAGSDIAGDVVSSVLGEDARPHAGKVLIGMGVAAIVAVVLVFIVRRSK